MTKLRLFFQRNRFGVWLAYGAFWALVFLLNTGPHWEKYSSTRELLETVGLVTVLQVLVAWATVNYLVPNFLDKGKRVLFFLIALAMLIVASEINIVVRYFYLEASYPESYRRFLENYGHMSFPDRALSLWALKYIFFWKIPLYSFPSAILVANDFYQKQKSLLTLREQKKSAELEALKNQLNPHFIFNTLNNIYSLAIQKSDNTAVAIEKLSGILDYVLYRCNKPTVNISDEVALIEDFIALERIRFGDRLDIEFKKDINENTRIAPLLLLTLLENACKHSMSEELNTATIRIRLITKERSVNFKISNSKPVQLKAQNKKRDGIGLQNLNKQLQLLYPGRHSLNTSEDANTYAAQLAIERL